MTILLVFLAIAIQSVLSAPVPDDLVVSLPDGQVQGTTYTTDNNITFYGFQGIPFATPPIGSLRFEAPQPPQPWVGVWNATYDRNSCFTIQNSIYKDNESEDCLYISVFIPSLQPVEKLPVLVWIHGGGFITGNADKPHYGPDFFIEEGVIMIMLNYRLGPFGFLSTGDSAIVGNAGLKDQTLAIKWVHDNVKYFGGDPDKITIWGESAGGVSVGLHLVNNKQEGLYRAAIVESGSAITNWTIDQNPKAYADILTTSLGGEIYLNDTRQLKNFLQQQTAEEIINAANLLVVHGGPVIEVENENAFLTESPYEILESGRFNKVPVIIGICANEALYFLNDLDSTEALALEYDTVPDTIIPPSLRQNSTDTDVVVKIIQDLYLNEGETFSSNLVALSSYFSDQMFTKGTIRHAELTSEYVPVYLYQFSYYGRPLIPFTIPGAEKVGHAGEIPFLFKRSNSTTDPADILTQNRLVRLWANFAKFLNPTPEQSELVDVVWPTMTATELQFLNINSTLEVGSPIRGASYQGWKNIFEIYGKKPIITF